jgi:hypothetical protein
LTNSQANDERRRNGSFRRSVCVKLLVNWNWMIFSDEEIASRHIFTKIII